MKTRASHLEFLLLLLHIDTSTLVIFSPFQIALQSPPHLTYERTQKNERICPKTPDSGLDQMDGKFVVGYFTITCSQEVDESITFMDFSR